MQEGGETTSTVTPTSRVELKNPFEHATPLSPEYTAATNTRIPEHDAATMTEHHPYQPQSAQEAELMKVITEAAGGDARMLEAMKSAMPAAEVPTSTAKPFTEPTGFKGILFKAGKGVYKVIVAIARALGVKPINSQ